jgi:hypothetical protein
MFCKALSTCFSRHELSDLIKYSAFMAEDSKGEVNFILVSTDIFMAEVCLSPPEYDDVEIVILPNGESMQAKYISVSELMTRLRNRKPGNVTHIDV